jgi:hypothetical protein
MDLHKILKNTLRSIEPKQNIIHPIKRKVPEILRPRLNRICRVVRNICRHHDVGLLNAVLLLLAVRSQSSSRIRLLCECCAAAAAAGLIWSESVVLLYGAAVAGGTVQARVSLHCTGGVAIIVMWLFHIHIHSLHQRLNYHTRFPHSRIRLRVEVQDRQTHRQGFVSGRIRWARACKSHVDCRGHIRGVRDEVGGLADAEGYVVESDELDDVRCFGCADLDACVGGLGGSDAGVTV